MHQLEKHITVLKLETVSKWFNLIIAFGYVIQNIFMWVPCESTDYTDGYGIILVQTGELYPICYVFLPQLFLQIRRGSCIVRNIVAAQNQVF